MVSIIPAPSDGWPRFPFWGKPAMNIRWMTHKSGSYCIHNGCSASVKYLPVASTVWIYQIQHNQFSIFIIFQCTYLFPFTVEYYSRDNDSEFYKHLIELSMFSDLRKRKTLSYCITFTYEYVLCMCIND